MRRAKNTGARSSGLCALACAIALGLCVVAPAAPGRGQGSVAAVLGYAGLWTFAGGRREELALSAAINAVVDRVDFFIREFARMEIHRRIRPEPRIQLRVEGNRLGVTLGDRGPIWTTLDGHQTRAPGPSGGPARWSARLRGGRIVQRIAAASGNRINVYSLSRDGRRLRMRVRIQSARLPADIVYRLSYARRSG